MYPKLRYARLGGMDTRTILRTVLLNAPALARLSGVSLHTIRAVLAGKRQKLYPSTRKKLADGLRKHAELSNDAADLLDPPPS